MVAGGEDHLRYPGVDDRAQHVVGADNVDLKDVIKGRLGAEAAQMQHRIDVLASFRDRLGVAHVDVDDLVAGLRIVDLDDVTEPQYAVVVAEQRPQQPSHVAGGAGDQ